MNEGTKELDASISSRRVLHMSAAVAPEVAGRRDFLTYKDFGLKEASNGLLRATLFAATAGMAKPTGWHYHTCQGQFYYIFKGWADLVFEDGTELRVQAGDVLFIPGGVKHNEIRTSDELESLEVCIPADMGTVAVGPPESWTARQ
jgi:mannose-6-phosphate isomerase-like protein (cupin superfamily)